MDATYAYVADRTTTKAFVYLLADGSRQTAQEFDFDSATTTPSGIAVNATYAYVLNFADRTVHVHLLSNGARRSAQEFTLHSDNGNPEGITVNATHAYVVDSLDRKVYAYRLAGGGRETSQEFDLDGANDAAPRGIAVDDTYAYVVDFTDNKVYAYLLPGYDSTKWVERTGSIQGNPGPRGSDASVNASNVDPLIAAYSGGIAGLDIVDAQIPAAIMRDAEFTAATVRTLLGLSATEVDDLLTGASISGQVLTYTQNDGSVVTLTVPDGADGVVSTGAFSADGTQLILTLDSGSTVNIGVPALLRSTGTGGLTQAQVDARVLAGVLDPAEALNTDAWGIAKGGTGQTDAAAALVALGGLTETQVDARAVVRYTDAEQTKLGGIEAAATADQTAAQILAALLTVDGATSMLDADLLDGMTPAEIAALASAVGFTLRSAAGAPAQALGDDGDWYINRTTGGFYEKVSGAWELRYTDQAGSGGGLTQDQVDARADTRIGVALAAAVTGNTETGISVVYNSDGTFDFVIQAAAQTHTNFVGITDGELTAVVPADFTVSGDTAALTIPAYQGSRRLLFARPASESDPSAVYLYLSGHRNTVNQLSTFTKSVSAIQLGGESHNWWGNVGLQSGAGGYVLEQVN